MALHPELILPEMRRGRRHPGEEDRAQKSNQSQEYWLECAYQ